MSSPMTFDGDCALETKKTTPPISKTSKPSKSLLTKFKTTSGFNKTSDFVLFVCTAGVFALFCFQALRSLDYDCTWKYRAAPGEWFYFKDGVKRFFMQLHLWSAIPTGIFLPVQFIPSLRKKYVRLHRISGRFLLGLLILASISGVVIGPYTFTGTLATQTAVWTLASLLTYCMVKSYQGILKFRIDVHRAWMIRTWGISGSILTMRPLISILGIMMTMFSPNGFFGTYTCNELDAMYTPFDLPTNQLYERHPICGMVGNGETRVIVPARLSPLKEETGATLGITFGVAAWIAILLHVILVEVYLNWTTDEAERLKKASQIIRKAKGLEN